jgi:hypothetical protein
MYNNPGCCYENLRNKLEESTNHFSITISLNLLHAQICVLDSINGVSQKKGMWHARDEKRNAYRILVGKPEGKRPLGRPRRM